MSRGTALGLGLVAGAALCYNLGVVLQAAEIRRPPSPGPAAPSVSPTLLDPRIFVRLARAPRWLVGAGLNLLGWILQAWAVTLLPLSVVQPGLTVGFVFLFALSGAVLGEKVGAREWLSGAVLVGGILLVAGAAPPPGAPTGDIGAWLLAGLPLAAATAWPYVQRRLARLRRERTDVRPGTPPRRHREGGPRVDLSSPHGPHALRGPHGPRWASLAVSAGAAYALTGIGTALGARLLAEGRPAGALATGALVAAFGAVGFLSETSGLQAGRATAVLPLLTAVDTIVPVAIAPALFHEPLGGAHGGLAFGLGLLAVAGGIAGLTTSSHLAVSAATSAASSPAAGTDGSPAREGVPPVPGEAAGTIPGRKHGS